MVGAELASCTSHTERRLVPTGAELRRYGKLYTPLRLGRERAEQFGGGQGTESRALQRAGVGDSSVKQIELEQAVPSSRFSEELRDFHAMLVTAKHCCCQRS